MHLISFQVIGEPRKVGPFNHYQLFSVQVADGRTFKFYTDNIYRVKTQGKVGFASLKMIFVNENTSKCFARFILFHRPEDTKSGSQVWKHGEVCSAVSLINNKLHLLHSTPSPYAQMGNAI